MNKFKYILFFVLFITSYDLLSIDNLDSLDKLFHNKILNNQIDKELGELTTKLSEIYSQSEIKKAIYYVETAFPKLSEKDIYNSIDINLFIGGLLAKSGNFSNALDYYSKALDDLIRKKHYFLLIHTYNYIGNIYYDKKMYQIALRNYKKSLEYYKSDNKNDVLAKAVSLNNIALVYNELKNFDSAFYYFNEALNIRTKEKDTLLMAHSYYYLSDIIAKKDLNAAKEYSELSWKFLHNYSNTIINHSDKEYAIMSILRSRAKFAIIHNFKNILKETSNYADSLLKSTNYISYLGFKWNLSLGEGYNEIHNYDSALKCFHSAKLIAQQMNNDLALLDCYDNIKNIHFSQKDFNNYQIYSLKYFELKEKIENQQVNSQLNSIIEAEQRMEFNNKIKEIEENRKAEERINNIIVSVVIIISIFIITIAVFYFKKHKSSLSHNRELQALNATKDKFFSIIAHDLKNPIGNFKNLTNILTNEFDKLSNEERIEFIEILAQSSNQINNLLENLLTWSRTQRGNIEFNPVQTDLYYIANNTIELLKASAQNKNIELLNNIPKNSNVNIDVNMITTVVRNLVSNSIKFTKENGKIILNLSKDNNNNIVVSIQDSGVGMNQKTKDGLFKIESANSSPGTNNESGTGLGLILCKEFIEKHNGRIWVESELGLGSTFHFSIPT